MNWRTIYVFLTVLIIGMLFYNFGFEAMSFLGLENKLLSGAVLFFAFGLFTIWSIELLDNFFLGPLPKCQYFDD